MTTKKLSIIIPVYNEEATVTQLLEQVVSATLPESISRELVIVDDCSTDNTVAVIQAAYPQWKVHIHQRNMGKGAAIRTGIQHASGDFIIIQTRIVWH